MTPSTRHPDPDRSEGEGAEILRFAQNDGLGEWGMGSRSTGVSPVLRIILSEGQNLALHFPSSSAIASAMAFCR